MPVAAKDEEVSDTPQANQPNRGRPRKPYSCGSNSIYENYMDYYDDNIQSVFTYEQHNVLTQR
ncbi:hypothetical protein [Candidatus Uabimicrobium sp. HlEnr_7]|uniref:hypothetical protein n=1 Tax=Candidatus Uabimicrobium helgolandensis TaxID=3095367 RepID=UPI0035564361